MDAYHAERKEILEKFGLALARRRDPATTSQTAFGERARLHRTQISFLERGEREPDLLTLLILADALGVEPGELLKDLPAPEERKPGRKRKAAREPAARSASSGGGR